jgi:hypothetical protein
MLLKMQKEDMFKQEAEESSRFVHKLGLYKLQCCLLMNGLVHEPTEVIISYTKSSFNKMRKASRNV